MFRQWLKFLVLFPMTVLVIDQAVCLTCPGDELYSFEISENHSRLDKLGSDCASGEEDGDPAERTCPLCLSRLFSLPASLTDASPTRVNSFRSEAPSFHQPESCQSIFRPPQA